ncbi:deoxyguanosinetriphosphate triphosphohydrolase [Thalassospira sp. TSL5-1]|uniref:deoxyguanosinetriphosphate triphosphohydrolase n=1 Tax=Thalassospira sp. TSL5-1 TaxID=1544451 RepID=UPI00093DEA73|nr:deoxyguanosinetriphosphate triphosphohydrolase [Thalassospira sp. TSL5-1]
MNETAGTKMRWEDLLSAHRLAVRDGSVSLPEGPARPAADGRSPFQIDVDRVIFSSSFRRLQNKTQVHPLSDNDHVHTRLTHTIEVGSVGQSLGLMAGAHIARQLGDNSPVTVADIGYMVQAACLAHDIGNPPFGHSGEDAINEWFKTSRLAKEELTSRLSGPELEDLRHFEGNAQGLRIVSQLEMMRFEGGLNLTYGTLGTFIKYPRATSLSATHTGTYTGLKKPGYYQAERHIAQAIAKVCGLLPHEGLDGAWRRHPLVYLVEAADDICYSVVDLEDGWELGCVTFEEVERALAPIARHPDKYDGDAQQRWETLRGEDWYKQKSENDRIGFLRGKAIGNLVKAAVDAFIAHEDELLAGRLEGDLLANTPLGTDAKYCKKLAVQKIYNAQHVLPIEIAGFEVIHGLLDSFVRAAIDIEEHKNHGKRLPPQADRIDKLLSGKLKEANDLYGRLMRVMDYISGMTDRYAVTLFRKLQGITI